MATKHRAEVALYFGKCEWGGMQLENEIADGRWLMFAVHPDALIRPPDLGQVSYPSRSPHCIDGRQIEGLTKTIIYLPDCRILLLAVF